MLTAVTATCSNLKLFKRSPPSLSILFCWIFWDTLSVPWLKAEVIVNQLRSNYWKLNQLWIVKVFHIMWGPIVRSWDSVSGWSVGTLLSLLTSTSIRNSSGRQSGPFGVGLFAKRVYKLFRTEMKLNKKMPMKSFSFLFWNYSPWGLRAGAGCM